MTDNLFARAKPKLNPPVSAWKADMPESREPQLVPPRVIWMNKINDVYLEIPRYDKGMTWWGMFPLALVVLLFLGFMLTMCALMLQYVDGYAIPCLAILSVVVLSTLAFFCLKIAFVTPRDQPIRLNCRRQNIYVFKYKKIVFPGLNGRSL